MPKMPLDKPQGSYIYGESDIAECMEEMSFYTLKYQTQHIVVQ